MKRRLFTTLSALSLLLCGWTLANGHGGPRARLLIFTRPDLFHATMLSYSIVAMSSSRGGPLWVADGYEVRRSGMWSFMGFQVWKATRGTERAWYIWIPCYPLLITAAFPLWWLLKHFRLPAVPPPGCCPRCSYDLRATPERCPECGRVSTAPPPR